MRHISLRTPALVLLALVLAVCLAAVPASAQAPATESWGFQGGPYAGAVFGWTNRTLPEVGFRFGASHGSRILDLRVSVFAGRIQKRAYLPPEWKLGGYEALAGLGWQPGPLGIGIRAGITTGLSIPGDRIWGHALEPHTVLVVPLGSSFELRSEAGVQLVIPTNRDLPGLMGKIRVGLERR